MTKLSVNVNKLATLRNSRGKNLPNLAEVSEKILKMGVHGLTVHPRPDGRHIRRQDVFDLYQLVKKWNQQQATHVEFNIEGYPSEEYLELVSQIQPDQATLVPDPPEALTSNAGWRVDRHQDFLSSVVSRLKKQKIRVSLFMDPQSLYAAQLTALKAVGADRAELYTEAYADAFETPERDSVTNKYAKAAEQLSQIGLDLNAGHDLNTKNLGGLVQAIPNLMEVSIGHAIFCEALDWGLEKTIARYLQILSWKS